MSVSKLLLGAVLLPLSMAAAAEETLVFGSIAATPVAGSGVSAPVSSAAVGLTDIGIHQSVTQQSASGVSGIDGSSLPGALSTLFGGAVASANGASFDLKAFAGSPSGAVRSSATAWHQATLQINGGSGQGQFSLVGMSQFFDPTPGSAAGKLTLSVDGVTLGADLYAQAGDMIQNTTFTTPTFDFTYGKAFTIGFGLTLDETDGYADFQRGGTVNISSSFFNASFPLNFFAELNAVRIAGDTPLAFTPSLTTTGGELFLQYPAQMYDVTPCIGCPPGPLLNVSYSYDGRPLAGTASSEVVLSAVPEPHTWAMLLGGLGLLGLRARRKAN